MHEWEQSDIHKDLFVCKCGESRLRGRSAYYGHETVYSALEKYQELIYLYGWRKNAWKEYIPYKDGLHSVHGYSSTHQSCTLG